MLDIPAAIPHRPPFLLVDKITAVSDTAIAATKRLDPEDELFRRIYAGHYPGNPITPGVLLCEMVFQTAAVLMSRLLQAEGAAGIPVLTKIDGARFKQMVLPGDEVEISAEIVDRIANACVMKGAVKTGGKVAVKVDFTVALVKEKEGQA